MLHRPVASTATILAMSKARRAPKATATAASGLVRRHSRHAATTRLTLTTKGAHALSSRSSISTNEPATRTATRAQSRQTRAGGRSGRGSAHNAASMLPLPANVEGPPLGRISRKYCGWPVPAARTAGARRRMCRLSTLVNVRTSTEPTWPARQHTGEVMTRNSTTAGAFQQAQLPVRGKLAAAWTSFMFLYIYVDYLHLYKPGSIDEILVGVVHEFDTGPTFVALALTLVAIPILMTLLSTTLPARVNRATNLVVATLYIPVSIYN